VQDRELKTGGPVDAVVLAGGPPAPALNGSALPKAFAMAGGSTMVEHVLAALRGVSRIRRIALVGPDGLPPAAAARATLTVPAAGGLLDNLSAGLAALGERSNFMMAGSGADGRPADAVAVLAAAADVPLLTSAAVAAFLDAAQAADADVAYAIVPREDVSRAAPGVRKTFVRLADGEFTGGGLVLLRPGAFARARPVIEQAVRARKRPWELARLFGLSALVGLATGRLRIAALERRAERIAGLRARAIVCRDAGVALDVDTAEMLELVRSRMASATGGDAARAGTAVPRGAGAAGGIP
jgi:molybdopterin-guanine dinucleotide biosynthesis protein A